MKIKMMNSKLKENRQTINALQLRINELQNENKFIDEIKLSKEELEDKLKKYINENNDLLKKIESKNNIIKEKELNIETLKKSLDEKKLIMLNIERNKNEKEK